MNGFLEVELFFDIFESLCCFGIVKVCCCCIMVIEIGDGGLVKMLLKGFIVFDGVVLFRIVGGRYFFCVVLLYKLFKNCLLKIDICVYRIKVLLIFM